MKISISTAVFGKEENDTYFITYLHKLSRAGYKYIEVSRKHDNLKQRLAEIDQFGLKVWAVEGTLKSKCVSMEESTRRDSVRSEMIRMNDTAKFAPCPYIIQYHDRFINTEYGALFRNSIEELHEKAVELGFVLALETVPFNRHFFERYPDSREIAHFVRSFNSPNLRMSVDINHSSAKEDIATICRECNGLIANVHVSDSKEGTGQHLPPGKGNVDIRAALEALLGAGYQGPCNLYCYLRKPTTPELRELRIKTEELCQGLTNNSDNS